MPPDGKLQLTLEELNLFNRWVKAGGDFEKNKRISQDRYPSLIGLGLQSA